MSSTKLQMTIHSTAIVDSGAKVPESCKIGPYCIIGPAVELGENCELLSHVVLEGPTKLGAGNKLYPFVSVGLGPQDLSYKGEPTVLEIGDRNVFREFVTVHRGTTKGGGITTVGNDCLIMAYAHIAHDCHVGNHVIMANAATLAGHVMVEDHAVVGAFCPVHQFVRIGAHSYIGGGTTITQDVLPFSKTVASRDVSAYGINSIGLRRRGFTEDRIRKLHHAYKVLLASKLNTSQALARLRSEGDQGEDVAMLIEWIEMSERGVIK
jgi:UDP-N-acetylglucosamine acyltransferase